MKYLLNALLIGLASFLLTGCGGDDKKSSGSNAVAGNDEGDQGGAAATETKTDYDLFVADFVGQEKILSFQLPNQITSAGGQVGVPNPTNAQTPVAGPIAPNAASNIAASSQISFASAKSNSTKLTHLKFSGNAYTRISGVNDADFAATGALANASLNEAGLSTAGVSLSQNAGQNKITLTLPGGLGLGADLDPPGAATPTNPDSAGYAPNAAVRRFEFTIKTYSATSRSGTADLIVNVSSNDNDSNFPNAAILMPINFSIAK